MKKNIIVFLPLMLFSLEGCSSEVTYTEITEEQFNAYYTDEKKAKAIEELDSYTTFSIEYTATQKNNDKSIYDYKELTQTDKNYSYCEKHEVRGPEDHLKDTTEYELVIATYPDESGSKRYNVVRDNILTNHVEQTLTEGEPAYDRYSFMENKLRADAKAYINNPVLVRYDALFFYKGSDRTLKVISQQYSAGLIFTYYIDTKTLFLKYYTFKDYGEALSTFNAKCIYRQNIKIDHKTANDIGFKDEE